MLAPDQRFNRVQDSKHMILIEDGNLYEVEDIIRMGQYVLVDIGLEDLVQDNDLMTPSEAGETYKLINYIKTKLL